MVGGRDAPASTNIKVEIIKKRVYVCRVETNQADFFSNVIIILNYLHMVQGKIGNTKADIKKEKKSALLDVLISKVLRKYKGNKKPKTK